MASGGDILIDFLETTQSQTQSQTQGSKSRSNSNKNRGNVNDSDDDTRCIGPCGTMYKISSVDMLECDCCGGWMCYKCLPCNKSGKKMLSKSEIQWKCPSGLNSQHVGRCANGSASDRKAQAQLPVDKLASIESKLDQTMQMLAASVQH